MEAMGPFQIIFTYYIRPMVILHGYVKSNRRVYLPSVGAWRRSLKPFTGPVGDFQSQTVGGDGQFQWWPPGLLIFNTFPVRPSAWPQGLCELLRCRGPAFGAPRLHRRVREARGCFHRFKAVETWWFHGDLMGFTVTSWWFIRVFMMFFFFDIYGDFYRNWTIDAEHWGNNWKRCRKTEDATNKDRGESKRKLLFDQLDQAKIVVSPPEDWKHGDSA